MLSYKTTETLTPGQSLNNLAAVSCSRRHCEERKRRPSFARSASFGGFESTEARSAEVEAIQAGLLRFARNDVQCHAAALTAAPLNFKPSRPAVIATFSPSLILPDRMSSASGSCTSFWITRLSGRAP